jgi:hypothetical protein
VVKCKVRFASGFGCSGSTASGMRGSLKVLHVYAVPQQCGEMQAKALAF